jgi:hypothetical protein
MADKKLPPAKAMLKSIFDFPNTLVLTDAELPEIKDWTVGEEYIVQLKVEQTSIRKKEDGSMCAEFKIISAKTEHEESEENGYADGSKVEAKEGGGKTVSEATSTKATPESDKKAIIDKYDMLKKGGKVVKKNGAKPVTKATSTKVTPKSDKKFIDQYDMNS